MRFLLRLSFATLTLACSAQTGGGAIEGDCTQRVTTHLQHLAALADSYDTPCSQDVDCVALEYSDPCGNNCPQAILASMQEDYLAAVNDLTARECPSNPGCMAESECAQTLPLCQGGKCVGVVR